MHKSRLLASVNVQQRILHHRGGQSVEKATTAIRVAEVRAEMSDREFIRQQLRRLFDWSMGTGKAKDVRDPRTALKTLDQLARGCGFYRYEGEPPPVDPGAWLTQVNEQTILQLRERVVTLGLPAELADRVAGALARRVAAGGAGGSPGGGEPPQE
jgi:hypothetical protein